MPEGKNLTLIEPAAGCCQGAGLDRRAVLQALTAAAAGVLVSGPVFAQAAAGAKPEDMPPQPGDFLVSDRGTDALTPDRINADRGPFEGWAMSPEGVVRKGDFKHRLLLFRFAPAELTPEAQAKAVDGVLALSVICTHAGCEVTEWLSDVQLMACPCHGSRFNPKDNGAVAQGPALRKLPQIALGLTPDGKLTVTQSYDSKVGGDELGGEDR